MNKKIIYSLGAGALVLILIIVIAIINIGKSNKGQDDYTNDIDNTIELYYTNSKLEFVTQKMYIEWSKNSFQTNVNYLLLKLQQTPDKDGTEIIRSIPENVTIERSNYNETNKSVEVDFNEGYLQLESAKDILCRAAIVKTLTQLPYVDSVKFFSNGKPLMASNGNPIGYIKSSDVILKSSDFLVTGEKYSIDLYFICDDTEALKNEKREIVVKPSDNIARLVLDELIKGPKEENLKATIPKDTVINDILVKDRVCYVDLNKAFADYIAVNEKKNLLTVYSIVNSLTELPNINQVQFLVDGAKQEYKKSEVEFNNLFSRNLDVIVKKVEEKGEGE